MMANHGYNEAMVMGSPISSPGSPGAHGAQSPYLPSYLMGEPLPATSPVQSGSRLFSAQSNSPPHSSFGKNTTFSSPFAGTVGFGHVSPSEPSNLRDVLANRAKEKPGAPPVTGLLETISSPTDRWAEHSLNTTGRHGQINCSQVNSPFNNTTQLSQSQALSTSVFSPDHSHMYSKKTPPSPAQVDPFYTQGESIRPHDELDETWVTIFGFPPAVTSFILQEFSQYGNILKRAVAKDGNWMHVHYQSVLQAKKALSKNGKIFGGSIMVGVTPCIDKSVIDTMIADAPVSKGTPGPRLNQSVCDRSMNASLNSSIRPLTAAYRAASSEHDVLNSTQTPQKNNGLINKAMEYVFGW